ncbi:MAG TPA: FAD-dependent oxidoreductase [Sedimentisphaerales bacterium]|nr:FAD-dependent oxidoreductase [Sedimentisphaerales bacterium]
MILTTAMTQLFAVVLRRDKERVTETLLREGVMQFLSTSELDIEPRHNQSGAAPDASLAELSDMRKRIEGILHTVGTIPSAPQETDLQNRAPVNLAKEAERLDRIDGERESIRERQRSLQQEILKLEDLRRQVNLYGVDLGKLQAPARQSMLAMQTGRLPASNAKRFEESLKGLPALHMALAQQDGMVHYLLLSMKRDQEPIERILSSVGWTKVEMSQEVLSARKNLSGDLTAKLQALTEEQKKLQDRVTDLIRQEEPHLKDLWVRLRIQELCAKIQASFQSSSRTVIFAGWLASSMKERLSAKIAEACEGRCYLEWHDADSDETIPCDTVIFAVGQRPDITEDFGLALSRGRIAVDDTLRTDVDGVFAAGDAVYGTASVIKAIAAGRLAAEQADRYLGGEGNIDEALAPEQHRCPYIGTIEGFSAMPREEASVVPATERVQSFCTMDLGLDEQGAHAEACRCLQCDLRLDIAPQRFWSSFTGGEGGDHA